MQPWTVIRWYSSSTSNANEILKLRRGRRIQRNCISTRTVRGVLYFFSSHFHHLILVFAVTPYASVYSRDLVWSPQGSQEKTLGSAPKPANPDILLAKLRPGQVSCLDPISPILHSPSFDTEKKNSYRK